MTKQEFIDSIGSWDDYIIACHERDDYDRADYLVLSENMLEYISNELEGAEDWENFVGWVSSIPAGYDCYDTGDYEVIALDNDDLNERVEEYADELEERGEFDEEDEETVDEDVFDEEPEEIIEFDMTAFVDTVNSSKELITVLDDEGVHRADVDLSEFIA